jgi:hypothetical protein
MNKQIKVHFSGKYQIWYQKYHMYLAAFNGTLCNRHPCRKNDRKIIRGAQYQTRENRELESWLGRVFNSKLGSFLYCSVSVFNKVQPLLELKTWPRFKACPWIIPLTLFQSWGPSYNFSIWYVGLEGDDSVELVRACEEWHQQVRHKLHRFILAIKYFRILSNGAHVQGSINLESAKAKGINVSCFLQMLIG